MPQVRIDAERMREIQDDLLRLSHEAQSLSIRALQAAAEIPGARVLDVPGGRPRFKARATDRQNPPGAADRLSDGGAATELPNARNR